MAKAVMAQSAKTRMPPKDSPCWLPASAAKTATTKTPAIATNGWKSAFLMDARLHAGTGPVSDVDRRWATGFQRSALAGAGEVPANSPRPRTVGRERYWHQVSCWYPDRTRTGGS